MITTSDDEKTITELSLISGISTDIIEKIFDAFLIQFVINYKNNKSINIPSIGSFLVKYREDIITQDGKEAQVDAFYAPHPQIKRLIGQLKDSESSKDFSKIDTVASIKKIVNKDFKTKIFEDELEIK